MTTADEASVFPIRLDLKQPFPETVDCGAPFRFTIAVETDSGCDLAGAPFRITDEAGETVAHGELPTIVRTTPESDAYDPRHGPIDMRDAAEIAVTAPAMLGSFAWTYSLPEHVIDGVRHREASLAIELTAKQHAASLAIWPNPTPVMIGASFSFKSATSLEGVIPRELLLRAGTFPVYVVNPEPLPPGAHPGESNKMLLLVKFR